MKKKYVVLLFLLAMILCPLVAEAAGHFVACSMRVSREQLRSRGEPGAQVETLGGITSLAGMVIDPENKDLIIVGKAVPGQPAIHMDDFVTALRTVLIHHELPLVSIDRSAETARTKKQSVFFGGHIEETQYGMDLLAADVVLKKLALGIMSAEVWGVRSYFTNYVQNSRHEANEDLIGSRFWFHIAGEPAFAERDGVFAIREMRIGVKTEVLYATRNGKPVSDLTLLSDPSGNTYTSELVRAYPDLCVAYPAVGRVKTLFDLAALAEGIAEFFPEFDLQYWLKDYKLKKVATPREYDLLKQQTQITGSDNRVKTVELTGGIEFDIRVERLRAGDVTALKEAVLESRPRADSLSWNVPLEGWEIPDALTTSGERSTSGHGRREGGAESPADTGCSIEARIFDQDRPAMHYDGRMPPPRIQPPRIRRFETLPPQTHSPRVGGVMLQGTAQMDGSQQNMPQVNLEQGGFSLIVEGRSAKLDPTMFRKLITALWAVHYGQQDPGISIDPIEWGGKKHLVRYIGKVINTDLGRVMREADYLMKQWAVGTSRPDLNGFQSPDDISGRRGTLYYGVSSRFWFVPEDMRFKEGDGMLLYDSGRMRVKTELNLQNDRGMKSDPSNEQFAAFLTDHYRELSERHPVLSELFEYAKLVQLSKYLKENGVPLFWFLMANKDLVLTEDSPGTVDALAKGSDYFRNIYIEGGVDLAAKGQHVYDAGAVAAIQQALSRLPAEAPLKTSLGKPSQPTPYPFSFDLKGQSYSVLPQHSLTSGRDRRGVLYQTDLALRNRGFQLTDRSLDTLSSAIHRRMTYEKLRPAIERMSDAELKTSFNRILEDAWKNTRGHAESLLAKLTMLKNRDFRTDEAFSKEVIRVVGPEHLKCYGDLIRKEARYATSLDVVRYLSPGECNEAGQFGRGWRLLVPYRMHPAGSGKRPFLNAIIPEKMELHNLITGEVEVLTFSEDRYSIAGYVPDRTAKTQAVGLFLLTDLSYRLRDKLGNEFHFDPDWNLTEMIFSEEHRIRIEHGYAESVARESSGTPYRLRPLRAERESFLNISLPKRMKVIDSASGNEETMVFDRENPNGIACYKPEREKGSRYTSLVFMTDGSFVLGDIDGNEISFDPGGGFSKMRMKVVKAIAQGPFRIEFQNEVQGGEPRIVEARVKQESQTDPLHIVTYEYGSDQRLCKITRSSPKAVSASHGPEVLANR